MSSVRIYFYVLYNAKCSDFRDWLASVNNETAITKNRMFDRYEAVRMIQQAAREAKDTVTANEAGGDVYRCLVHLMRTNGLGLRLRRADYLRITTQVE